MWMELNASACDDLLGDEDRVLVVVAVPGHERAEQVPAEGQLSLVGRRPVGDDLAGVDLLVGDHDGLLGVAGVLVRALVLQQRVDVLFSLGLVRLDPDFDGGDVGDHAAALGDHHTPES